MFFYLPTSKQKTAIGIISNYLYTGRNTREDKYVISNQKEIAVAVSILLSRVFTSGGRNCNVM